MSAPKAVPVAYTSSGRIRLPPSRAAWRMAACRRRGGSSAAGRVRSSAASMRRRHWVAACACMETTSTRSGVGRGAESFGRCRVVRISEQLHPQLGLLPRLLAAAVQADAAFVGGERPLEAQLAALHLLAHLLECVERGVDISAGCVFGGS